VLLSQVPVQINDSCAVLPAYQHVVFGQKAENSVAVVPGDFFRPLFVVCFARAAAVLLLILRNRRSAVPDRVLHLCRTLTLTATLSNKNVAARAAILAADGAYDSELILYGTLVQLVKKMLDVGGLMERMSGVRFSSFKTQNPNAKLF
jgi:hypothetical protein